jgi:hypothetical protein
VTRGQQYPNGALRTNKVLMRTGFIYLWSRLTKYSYKKHHTKGSKKVTPLHVHIRLISEFKKRGGGRGR